MTDPKSRVSRAEAAGAIGMYVRYFNSAAQPPQVRSPAQARARRASPLPADTELDQPVEFVQFSANTRTLLAPADDSLPAPQQLDSVTKLRGVEFHHFAAFYKSSWRAWDWMWGRLDGSGWLVHILLDPARILAVVENQPLEFPEQQRAARFAQKLREAVGLPVGLPDDCLVTDLAFLDHHDADIPVSLPNSALFIARAWQNLITANELPAVAERMVADGGRLPPLTSPRPGVTQFAGSGQGGRRGPQYLPGRRGHAPAEEGHVHAARRVGHQGAQPEEHQRAASGIRPRAAPVPGTAGDAGRGTAYPSVRPARRQGCRGGYRRRDHRPGAPGAVGPS